VIPPDADPRLQQVLVRSVALAKWGEEGLYQVTATSDPAVQAAVQQLDRAAVILSSVREP